MKHTIRFIFLLLTLAVVGAGSAWALDRSDIIINPVLPNASAGEVKLADGDAWISGRTVKIVVTPTSGFKTKKSLIIVEKMIDPSVRSLQNRAYGIAQFTLNGDDDWVTSETEFTFTVPEEYDGAYISTTFVSAAANVITSLDDIPNTTEGLAGTYELAADIDASGFTGKGEFTGTLDGKLYKIYNLSTPLFASTDGATIRNITFESVNISVTGNAGAVTREAKGATRIYNCGILPSSTERDEDGNIKGFIGSSVSGTEYTGGLVGKLDGTSRVINCYSYANITGGTDVGGIVGYNNVATTAATIATGTMVMNCMFYADITGGTTKSPVYGGKNINNLQDGLNTFNYYSYETLKGGITENKYNCALAVEEKYLTRFEFYRLLLNSNKKLAAFYATGSPDNANEMAKWVLETADRTIDNPTPYPVLKARGYYPSIINPDFENAPDSASVGRNHGGKLGKTLSVTISGVGSNAPAGANITTGSLTLQRTDKDFDRFNFNYDKVQLPYYNDVGEGNYTGNRVVTGWKITAITTVANDPYTATNYDYNKTYASNQAYFDYPNYNFADRKSSNKDLYSVSGRIFSQGAYFDVPYGVTSITIEPYWGKACYIADPNYDVVYKNDYSGKQDVTQTGTQVNVGTTTFNGQNVQKSIEPALNYIANNLGGLGPTVYDNALVLVGNLHLNTVPLNGDRPFTMMSVDTDNDHEPDYSLIYHHKGRSNITPIRFDFLNIPGTAQAQKPNGASLICNFTIFKTRGWFEVTNTAFMYSSQIEYENGDLGNGITKIDAPLILHGGIFDQFVSTQLSTVNGHTIYIHVGSNVWIKSFGLGTHSDGSKSTPHVPVSVTGGDFEEFYLTGTYNANANIQDDNAECYISGGRFGEVAGAALEQIGLNDNTTKGNVRWQIYEADITSFFGGGINDAKPVKGNITTDIFNSHVNLFCGGPKFGNMATNKIVTTTAAGCTFGKYFGAGYGGTSLSKKKYYDATETNWTTWAGKYISDRGKYFDGATTGSAQISGKDYGKKGVGVATDLDYEFFVWSSGQTGGRFFVKFASFSLAQCNNVSSTLKKCTVETNFYGGGNLGKVVGTATSVLEDCTVKGNVYGAGYSASLPTVEVRDGGFSRNPNYNSQSGMFEPAILSGTTTFTWQNAAEAGVTLTDGNSGSDLDNHILYTNTVLTGLGEVANTNLTITGTTNVGESIYGGGEESGVAGDTHVTVNGGSVGVGSTGKFGYRWGNVYGGGKGKIVVKEDGSSELVVSSVEDLDAGYVKGNTNIEINGTTETTKILHNVYGGGAVGSVGTFTRDASGMPTACAANTGLAIVTIKGGKIGHDHVDTGMVNGSSRGWEGDPEGTGAFAFLNQLAWINNSNVVIGDPESDEEDSGPSIWGSVYGGGENGHNFENGRVTVNKGTIGDREGTWDCGNVYGAGCGTDTFWRDKNGDGEVDEDETKNYNPMAGLVRGSTYVTINGGHVLRNVYGAGSMGSVGIYTIKAKHDDLTDGFGLSWPYEFEYDTYIDSQDGNTEKTSGKTTVTINGGRIGTNGDEGHGYVYGAAKGAVDIEEHNIDKHRYAEALYANVRETEVIINYPSTPPSGDLVTIDPSTSATIINDNAIPCIAGAVFGGGEDGHVYENAKIEIRNGLIGNSVYGGGRGKSTYRGKLKDLSDGHEYETDISSWIAGKVYGNIDIIMTGGHVVRNIYGGGNLGSVGKGNYSGGDDDYYPAGYGETLDGNLWTTTASAESPDNAWHFLNSGKITVKVQNGTVGMDNGVQDGLPVGSVFGSSRGRAAADVGNKSPRYKYAPDFYLGYANETEVEIGKEGEVTGPTIWGSVYGGGRDGHVRRNTKVTVFGGTIGRECTSSSVPTGIQWTERGNVFGSGSGMGMYDSNGDGTPDKHGTSSGSVTGWTEVHIKGGTVYQNVYGGGALSSVGAPKLNQASEEYRKGDEAEGHGIGKQSICEVNIEGGTIGTTAGFAKSYGGYVFGAGRGGGLVSGELPENFATSVWTEVNVKPDHNPLVCGSVFGGGEQGLVKCGVDVNITGGEIENDVYGGGAKAHTNTSNWDATNDTWADAAKSTKYTTEVQLKGGKVDRNVYGGALGQTADAGKGLEDIAAIVYGDVLVELNNDEYVADSDKGCIVLGSIFGCNNLNGTPMGDVKVHIYKTQNKDASRITNAPASGETPAVEDAKVLGRYDVPAVYGGGNQSAYEPADQTNNKTEVIIDGCAKTSIEQVYGGGNASSTPATNVTVNGTFEIEELFGGGNGKDNILINGVEMPNPGANVGYKDYSEYYYEDDTWKVRDKADADTKAKRMASDYVYGTGKASVNIYGGTVHRVFGGSNTKGNVRQTAVTLLDEIGGCEFCVDEAYGGGKSAEMDAEAQLLMACIPGLRAVYGGAEAADVRGNVTLNITNGTFDRVFGGNNLSGTIGGSITVNVEEIGCKPVKIGELYGGGNLAGYSVYGYNSDGTPKESGLRLYEDPKVNVMSFTSIGNVYGGGYGNTAVMVGNPTVNVNVAYGRYYDNVISNVPENTKLHDTYPIPSHAVGKMGAIYNVFGGGNAAKVIGNTTVNIATLEEVYVVKQVAVGADVSGYYTRSGAGTAVDPFVYTAAEGTALDGVTYYEKKDVLGADIRNNVYGGGNNAEVTGNANVNIGKREDD